MYEVLKAFRDGENGKAWLPENGGHTYYVGDDYPKGSFQPSLEHIEYLLGRDNFMGCPVIEEIDMGTPSVDPAIPPAAEAEQVLADSVIEEVKPKKTSEKQK